MSDDVHPTRQHGEWLFESNLSVRRVDWYLHWWKQRNLTLQTDEIKNISSWRNSDLLTKKSKPLIFSKLKCFNKLFSPSEAHRWLRHAMSFDFFASHWVMKTIYLVAPLRLAVFATSTCNRQVKQHARMKDIVISVSLLQSHLTLVWLLAPLIARPLSFASERKRWCK